MASAAAADRNVDTTGADQSPADGTRYFAFISYSHQDELWARWLHKALETYRVPLRLVGTQTACGVVPRRLLPIFRDRDELASATDLSRQVNAALARSVNLIVICSPQSAASRWVNEEVLAFKRLGNAERIFCLIVGGEPNASDLGGREREECFAPALRFHLGADGQPTQQRTEPVAADARAGKDGKANARLKLIAGMLGVGFDRLKQRELQRRNRRMAALTAIALLVTVITTALAITAVIARHDAERRQKQAEDLVGFMLGDLNDKLREVERLDILQAVDDKAMAYFASLPTKDVTDAALAKRVDALQKIGSVRQSQGQGPAALEAYRAASELANELLQRSPASIARQADYANSLLWIGNVYWYQGDLQQALQDFQTAGELLRKASAQNPDDTDLAYKLSFALTNTGRVLESRGDFAAAKPYYESVLKLFEALRAKEPANTTWQSELGDAYDNLGKLAIEQGQLDQAIAAYRADQRIKKALFEADRGNHHQQEYLAISNAILGRTLAICGEIEAAPAYMSDAVANIKALLQFDPTQANWQFLQARYSEQLGGVLRQLNQTDAAATVDAESLRLLDALTAKDPTNAEWRQEQARSQIENARLMLARHAVDAAEKSAGAASAAIDKMLTESPDDRNVILLAAQADVVSGQAAAERRDAATAHERWVHARDAIAPVAQAGTDLSVLAVWASALLLLDDVEAARPVVAKLSAAGYRTPDFLALLDSRQLAYPANAQFAERIAESMK